MLRRWRSIIAISLAFMRNIPFLSELPEKSKWFTLYEPESYLGNALSKRNYTKTNKNPLEAGL